MLPVRSSVCALGLTLAMGYVTLSISNSSAQDSQDGSERPNKPTAKATGKSKDPKEKKGSAPAPDSDDKEGEEPTTEGVSYSAPRSMEMQFGMRFSSNENWCSDLHATIPFPMNWPEQKVTLMPSEVPVQMRYEYRNLPAGAKQSAYARQLVMDIASMGPNSQLDMLINVKIEKSFIDPPPDPSVFVIPKKLSKELSWFMGSSPYIDVEIGEIKRVAKQIAAQEHPNAWAHVEAIYDWVRENIKYRNGQVRKIADALKDKQGDCEEMTGIFVALCRASKIPARCVWIPEHCYPEFYLEDPQGNGHWFPCQAAGERQFGQMHDYRPILQKGDRFKVPENTAPQRYLATFFKCTPRPTSQQGRDPSIEEIRDLGPLQAELDELKRQTDRPAE